MNRSDESNNGGWEKPVQPARQEQGGVGPEKGRHRRQDVIFGFLVGVAATLLVIYVLSLGKLFAFLDTGSIVSSAVIRKVDSLVELIESSYYLADKVTDEQLVDGMYKGVLDALDDPYSAYYTAEEVQDLSESISGSFTGIGAYVSQDEDTLYPKIAGVIGGSPAEEAGLMTDDLICEVEGESMQGVDLDIAVSRIRGEEGTSVHITIYRSSISEYMELDIVRAVIDSVTVSGEMLDGDAGIGYIQITEFDDVTPEQFTPVLEELLEQGMEKLILDLRDNPGGTVDAVTSIAQYLVPEGLVFYMEYPDGTREEYEAEGDDTIGIPIVVLVNGNSASASEILASCIQDSGAGIVLGTQTYGKGVVQTVYSLTDGTAVKLTMAQYYTRGGSNIHGVGVTPDVEVELDTAVYQESGTDTQLEAAMEELQKDQD